ncbi:hypothetical protein JCM10207_009157 [Rhodosporidiobolus poonsookiae]
MTSSAKLVANKVDASYRIAITCDFEADLSDKNIRKTFPLENVPLAGKWSLDLEGTEHGVKAFVRHGTDMSVGRIGSRVVVEYKLYWLDSGIPKLVDDRRWPPELLPGISANGSAYGGFACLMTGGQAFGQAHLVEGFDPKRARRYQLVFELQQQCLKMEHDSHRSQKPLTFDPNPHNFRLFFPKLGKDGASLWVNADLLSGTCPYFKDLLASDFAEAAPRRAKCLRPSGEQPLQPEPTDEKDFEDSDDETDEYRFAEAPPGDEEPPDNLSFREIKVTRTAFSTYHALLTFMQTGYLHFAPLKSAFKPSNPAGIETRGEFIKKLHDADPSLPLPVSPKSLYRLVDLLRVPGSTGLATLCLDKLADSLSIHGAAHELFSDVSMCFEPIRKMVISYVVANWAEVRATPSWTAMMERIKAGELPDAAGIIVELVEAREAAMEKA